MNLYQLQYFQTLARLEHYTRAAAELSITQPSLSHSISGLEEELGVPLFRKQGRNVVLTEYGKVFLKYINDGLSDITEGARHIRELSLSAHGRVRLGYVYPLGIGFVPQLVHRFCWLHKENDIRFSLGVGVSDGLLQSLKDDRLDLAICSRTDDEDIDFTPVAEQRLVVIAQPSHPLARRETVALSEVAGYPFIHYVGESRLNDELTKLLSIAGVTPRTVCEAEDEASIASLVASGMGIAVVPDLRMLSQFRVKKIPIREPNYVRRLCLAQVRNRYLPPQVALFRDFLLENAGKTPDIEA